MEAIRNYLESMFRNLPNTEKVLKAKNELFQMMEDKYAELRREGKSENEAVGTVISEFGNLDEVAASLGIKEEVSGKKENPRRGVSLEEIKSYIDDKIVSVLLRAISIVLYILSPSSCILFDDIFSSRFSGVVLMFVMIGIATALMIVAHTRMDEWRFIKKEPCSIGPDSSDYILEQKRNFHKVYTILLSVGLVCLICSFIPPVVVDEISFKINSNWGAMLFFICVALGVGCIVYGSSRYGMYQRLLGLNSNESIGGSYASAGDKEPEFNNKTMKAIMSIYWPSITCIYLAISFLTFHWGITWIIWPIAGVVHRLLVNLFAEN